MHKLIKYENLFKTHYVPCSVVGGAAWGKMSMKVSPRDSDVSKAWKQCS